MTTPLWAESATALAGMIARRETSSRAVVEAHLDRIAAVNGAVNAIVTTLADSARAGADAADAAVAAGVPLGPLHGVPFTIKANIDLVGTPTTHGVPAFANAMPDRDAPVVARMKAAGAIPLARTNLPDMALRVHTDSALYGLTRNPFNGAHTVGGSSGGEGAALASGMSPIGLGNDIGGSLRNPAFACGIVSLKPGFGRIPDASAIEPKSPLLASQLMAVQGPMARHVADLRLALAILAGTDPRDPNAVPAPLVGPAITGSIKVAVVTDPPGGRTAPEISASVRAAADALADAGYDVQFVSPPMLEEAAVLWGRWLAWEFETMLPQLEQIMSADAMHFFKDFSALYGKGSFADNTVLHVRRHDVALAWSAFFAEYPLILGPAWTRQAFEHGFDIAGPESAAETIELLRYIVPMNLLGLPVVCVPTGVANGLPLGVQITANRFREDLALDAAEAIEKQLGHITPIDPRG